MIRRTVAASAAVLVTVGLWLWWAGREAEPDPTQLRTVFVPSGPPTVTLTDTLRVGQTLGQLFDAYGLSGPDAVEVVNLLRRYKNPRSLRPGTIVQFEANLVEGPTRDGHPLMDGLPIRILLQPDPDARLVLDSSRGEWLASLDSVPVVRDTVRLTALIERNLYDAGVAGDTTGMASAEVNQVVWALSEVFAWRIDFYRDIRSGDAYRTLVERLVRPNGSVRSVRVLAAEFRNRDRVLTAIRFQPPEGRAGYFDQDGGSVRRAFLLAPLDFRRVTSGFSGRRFHPVLKRYRAHLGTDYGAPPGTSVRATGDGVVRRAGWWGSYGRMVEIRHANRISTRYAHLSRVSVRPGQRVAQGHVIGRVGSTGLATASHLHYEFLQHGRHRNPARLNLPPAEPVPEELKPAFIEERDRLLALLSEIELPALARMAEGSI